MLDKKKRKNTHLVPFASSLLENLVMPSPARVQHVERAQVPNHLEPNCLESCLIGVIWTLKLSVIVQKSPKVN